MRSSAVNRFAVSMMKSAGSLLCNAVVHDSGSMKLGLGRGAAMAAEQRYLLHMGHQCCKDRIEGGGREGTRLMSWLLSWKTRNSGPSAMNESSMAFTRDLSSLRVTSSLSPKLYFCK